MKIRLNKFISQAGICSRRRADELILDGQIIINNKVVKELGTTIDLTKDKVFYNNQEVGLEREKEYVVLNKPIGYVCTHRKFQGEKNIFELLPKKYQNLICVGRLDKNSRGLVLLTNDGELAQKLAHPSGGHEKEYIVQINKGIEKLEIEKLEKGFKLNNLGFVAMKSVKSISNQSLIKDKPGSRAFSKSGSSLQIILTQGKKRQIREMLGKLGIRVLDLQRIRIDKIRLGNLKEGGWKLVSFY